MKKVLILGASGNFGGAVLRALRERADVQLLALQRPQSTAQLPEGVEVVRGDGRKVEDLRRACAGVDTVIYGLHLGYVGWRQTLLPAARAMAQVAEEFGLRVVYPGNVYGLGPDFSAPLAEDCSHRAPTEKGEVRNEIEALWRGASTRGARVLIVRAGDFFGPGSQGTWLEHLVPTPGNKLTTPSRSGVNHAWAYLPDLGETVARLLEREDRLRRFDVFHFRGHEASALEFIRAAGKVLGRKKIGTFPWWSLHLAGVVSPLMRELLKMRYLWDTPVLLDQRKLEAFLGSVPHTPLELALGQTFKVAFKSEYRVAA